jgi:hypothetical protein
MSIIEQAPPRPLLWGDHGQEDALTRRVLRVIEGDTPAIVAHLDALEGLPAIEEVRVFVLDRFNFETNLRDKFVAAGVHFTRTPDGERYVFALDRVGARALLEAAAQSIAVTPAWIEQATRATEPGELLAVAILGNCKLQCAAPLARLRADASGSGPRLAVDAAMRETKEQQRKGN